MLEDSKLFDNSRFLQKEEVMLPEAKKSRRMENRISRRYARLMRRKDSMTHEHLVGELMMAQIDATLSVSHAIQEWSDQLGKVGLEIIQRQPPPFGGKYNYEVRLKAAENDIGSIRQSLALLRQALSELRREQPRPIDGMVGEAEAPQRPWWAFWRKE